MVKSYRPEGLRAKEDCTDLVLELSVEGEGVSEGDGAGRGDSVGDYMSS